MTRARYSRTSAVQPPHPSPFFGEVLVIAHHNSEIRTMSRSFARRLRGPVSRRNQASRLALEHLESRDVPALFNTLSPVSVSTINNFGCVATGDFTGNGKDGKVDLVMTNYGTAGPGNNAGGSTIAILFPSGDGTFTLHQTITVDGSDQYVSYVAVGDLNGDGFPDLAIVSNSENAGGNLTIYTGNGNGGFTKGNTYSTGLDNADWVGIAPMFAGSNVPSIVVSAFGHTSGGGQTVGGNAIDLFQGNGGRAFQSPITFNSGGLSFIPTACALGQFSGSSNMDIACVVPGVPPDSGSAQPDGTVQIILNNGSGGLTAGNSFDSGGALPVSLATTQFTSSGRPDLVVANAGDPTT